MNLLRKTSRGIDVVKIIFCVTPKGEGYLIEQEDDTEEKHGELFYDCSLEDVYDIPEEAGIYKGELELKYSLCNHPEDPEEFDVTIVLTKYKKIEVELWNKN